MTSTRRRRRWKHTYKARSTKIQGLLVKLLQTFEENLTAAIEKEVKAEDELLQGTSKKISAEGKTKKDLYEKFVCWGDSVISAETAPNADAKAGIDELEFTSERTDLEKSISGLKSDIEAAQAQRRQGKADFLAARDEM